MVPTLYLLVGPTGAAGWPVSVLLVTSSPGAAMREIRAHQSAWLASNANALGLVSGFADSALARDGWTCTPPATFEGWQIFRRPRLAHLGACGQPAGVRD